MHCVPSALCAKQVAAKKKEDLLVAVEAAFHGCVSLSLGGLRLPGPCPPRIDLRHEWARLADYLEVICSLDLSVPYGVNLNLRLEFTSRSAAIFLSAQAGHGSIRILNRPLDSSRPSSM